MGMLVGKEMVYTYNRIHHQQKVPAITMHSVINEVFERYKGRMITSMTRLQLKEELTVEMLRRRLDRHFQVILSTEAGTLSCEVVENNIYHPPEECVIWN